MKLNRKIDFFIVGAAKAGTTSLYRYLRQHEDIYLPPNKDFFVFNDDPTYGVPVSKIGVYYRKYDGEPLVGGSNVMIMRFAGAVRNLHHYNPDARLIVMLRNPVDRAYSNYWMMRRTGQERYGTFEAALAQGPIRVQRGLFREVAQLLYVESGYYHEQIRAIYELFDRERVYIGLFDDLKANPKQVTRQVLDHLGANSSGAQIDFSEKHNRASVAKYAVLQRAINSQNRFKRMLRSLVPFRLRVLANEALFEKIADWNQKFVEFPPMAPKTRADLADHFRPLNERLSDLIGRDLSHWR